MNKLWDGATPLKDKLFAPVLMEILTELLEKGEIKSITEFTHEYRRCYVQVSKYKHWLRKKGLIIFIKESKCERMVLTEQGKKIIKAFGKLLNEMEVLDK